MNQSSEQIIRHFQQEDMPLLAELYESVGFDTDGKEVRYFVPLDE